MADPGELLEPRAEGSFSPAARAAAGGDRRVVLARQDQHRRRGSRAPSSPEAGSRHSAHDRRVVERP